MNKLWGWGLRQKSATEKEKVKGWEGEETATEKQEKQDRQIGTGPASV